MASLETIGAALAERGLVSGAGRVRSLGDTPTGWGGPAAYRRSITRPMAFITKPALDRGMNEPCLSSLPGTFVFRRPDPPRHLTPRREGVWSPQTSTGHRVQMRHTPEARVGGAWS